MKVYELALFLIVQQLLNLREIRFHAVEMLLHIVNFLLGFVVDREVDDRLVLIPRGLPVLAHHDDRGLKRRDLVRDALSCAARMPEESKCC